MVGQKIAQLEARKRAAVEKEDYDTAKLIKAVMDKLRAAGEGAAMAPGAIGASKNPDDIFNRVLGHKPVVAASPSGGGGAPQLQLPFDEQPVGRPGSGPSRRPTSAQGGSNANSPGQRGPTSEEGLGQGNGGKGGEAHGERALARQEM